MQPFRIVRDRSAATAIATLSHNPKSRISQVQPNSQPILQDAHHPLPILHLHVNSPLNIGQHSSRLLNTVISTSNRRIQRIRLPNASQQAISIFNPTQKTLPFLGSSGTSRLNAAPTRLILGLALALAASAITVAFSCRSRTETNSAGLSVWRSKLRNCKTSMRNEGHVNAKQMLV